MTLSPIDVGMDSDWLVLPNWKSLEIELFPMAFKRKDRERNFKIILCLRFEWNQEFISTESVFNKFVTITMTTPFDNQYI